MAAEQNLRPLKMLVISLGLMLIGGTFLLGALLWKKGFEGKASTQPDCQSADLDLTGRGTVVDSHIDGGILRLVLEESGRDEVLTIDICSGRILGSFSIQSDPAGETDDNCDKSVDYGI